MTLDHGELNIPGRTRGLDRQIDAWKRAQREEAKRKAKALAELRAHARDLVRTLPADKLARIAERANLTPRQAHAKLRGMATSEPSTIVRTLGGLA